MIKSDSENLELVESIGSVDALNAKFYGRYPYPWTPMIFHYFEDKAFDGVMLNQSVGDFEHRMIPSNPSVWVAGCGTNQAVSTALRFQQGSVRGSDLSTSSLQLCKSTAESLNITNLELVRESLNEISYKDRFDYVICTGVIHHNAEPRAVLEKIAAALKPHGVLELMVYNRYHRTQTTAFQKAVRLFGKGEQRADFESDLLIAKRIIHSLPDSSPMVAWLREYKDSPEARTADSLLQPVEYSYTVESLADLAASCGLELLLPCIDEFDKALELTSWNMEFEDPQLQSQYESLPDLDRWQITNLLMLDKSPMLWFYMQRKDSGRERKTEAQVCEQFLNKRFVRNVTRLKTYIKEDQRNYKLSPRSIPYPLAPDDPTIARIVEAADGKSSMRDIFKRLEMVPTFQGVNQVRIKTTSSAFPHLKAVSDDDVHE